MTRLPRAIPTETGVRPAPGSDLLRVLVVEDEPPRHVGLGAAACGGPGSPMWRMVRCSSMGEAVVRLDEGDFDVVLIDVDLARPQGLAAVGTVHGTAPAVPVIVLADATEVDVAEAARAKGARDVVTVGADPLTLPDDLRDVVARCLQPAGGVVAWDERDRELARLREMNAMKTRLLRTASHEMNTPLTPLKLQLHILRDDADLTARQRRAVEVLDRNIDRLANLVGDFLDAARLESGRLQLHRVTVDVTTVVRDATDVFEEVARTNGVHLDVATVPASIDADPARLSQVLFNLLSNAFKFTGPGGRVRVRVTVRGAAVEVRVEDTGAGLTVEQMDRLFKPFSRVHDTGAGGPPGTGLGLHISRGIIEEHGGRMWCESAGPGEGAALAFVLPLSSPPT